MIHSVGECLVRRGQLRQGCEAAAGQILEGGSLQSEDPKGFFLESSGVKSHDRHHIYTSVTALKASGLLFY